MRTNIAVAAKLPVGITLSRVLLARSQMTTRRTYATRFIGPVRHPIKVLCQPRVAAGPRNIDRSRADEQLRELPPPLPADFRSSKSTGLEK